MLHAPRLRFVLIFAVCSFSGFAVAAQAGDANSIAPRKPDIPAGDDTLANPIDRFLTADFAAADIDPQAVVTDEVFARRVYEDLVGLLPSPDELNAFVKDDHPDKRRLLVRKLLDDRRAYAEHWMTFWNDALRNAYRGTGFIDDGRRQITGWLFAALYDNKPYDRFVHELISPVDGSEGFIKGIVWRGTVNASQRRELQAAQTISQVFLGTNLKCASCHDSFLNEWTLDDAYGLANVFAEEPLETFECDKPIGEFAPVKFLFPQVGAIDGGASREVRIKQLADVMTSPQNGRLTRTIVNRLWAQLFGHGLVEPIDEMEKTAWNPDLLDWLAADLVEHNYDLKHTLELICTSRAYQLPSVGFPSPEQTNYKFRGPFVKRMSGEQFLDAVAALTGVWPQPSGQMLIRDGRGQGGQLMAVARALADRHADQYPISAHWVWNDPAAAQATTGGPLHLRRTFELPAAPQAARAVVACDNSFKLFVNGKEVAAGENWEQPTVVDLTPHLKPGTNLFAALAVNGSDKDKSPEESSNPAGFLLQADITFASGRTLTIVTDESWICRPEPQSNWEHMDFVPENWQLAEVIGDAHSGPWHVHQELVAALIIDDSRIRAAWVMDDDLTRALGRSNREQVVTRRQSVATTLQALELTNGGTLDAVLKQGGENWLQRGDGSSAAIINGVYTHALGRAPTAEEAALAVELVGEQPTAAGVQDLLWAMVMLPEFQLIP